MRKMVFVYGVDLRSKYKPGFTRTSSALHQRYAFVFVRCVRRDFCACTKKCARSSTHLHARRTPYTCTERVEPTPATRGAHAGYSLYVRRLRSSEHAAHTCCTRSAHRTHTQRISNARPALHARTIRSVRQQHAVHSMRPAR